MPDSTTYSFIESFKHNPAPVGFFSGFFKTRPGSIFTTEQVTMDIMRHGVDIASPVSSIASTGRSTANLKRTNKTFDPFIFNETCSFEATRALKRAFGRDATAAKKYMAEAGEEVRMGVREKIARIQRSFELMGSQVLQTGTITGRDPKGNVIQDEDFKLKASHKITAGTDWSDSAAAILGNLEAACKVVHYDHYKRPNAAIMGDGCLAGIKANTEIEALLDIRRVQTGFIKTPSLGNDGAQYHGDLTVGTYVLELWTYNDFYEDPADGVKKPYLDDGTCIVIDKSARFDAAYGAIPDFSGWNPQNMNILRRLGISSPRISLPGHNVDMNLTAYLDKNMKSLHVDIATRGILIPTAIESYAVIDTTP